MRLSTFIRQNRQPIIEEWNAFARTLLPATKMSELALTDHINELLTFFADDIETAQTSKEQIEKSQGQPSVKSGQARSPARVHATGRYGDGFDIVEMISEYRALRATISKLWQRADDADSGHHRDDLERFHEAVDQAVAESVVRFSHDVEKARHLLLGVLGHDIRNPVAAMQMAADLIPRVGDTNAKQQHLLDQVSSSAMRVQEIVADLLDLARSASAGQAIPMRLSQCSMSNICRQIVDEAQVRNPQREIHLVAPSYVEGWWDEIRLGQMLANLVNNAVQYGDVAAPIVLTLEDEGVEVVVSVHNEGNPIPAVHLRTIFKSFTRVSETHSVGASQPGNLGLGLFIASEIVAAHGGKIDVTSDKTEGTTFRVQLPKFRGEHKPS